LFRGAPSLTVLPELALALFVAPVLLDAAYDRFIERSSGQRPAWSCLPCLAVADKWGVPCGKIL
jgi:hypothetical protein